MFSMIHRPISESSRVQGDASGDVKEATAKTKMLWAKIQVTPDIKKKNILHFSAPNVSTSRPTSNFASSTKTIKSFIGLKPRPQGKLIHRISKPLPIVPWPQTDSRPRNTAGPHSIKTKPKIDEQNGAARTSSKEHMPSSPHSPSLGSPRGESEVRPIPRRNPRRPSVVDSMTGEVELWPGHRTSSTTVPPNPTHVNETNHPARGATMSIRSLKMHRSPTIGMCQVHSSSRRNHRRGALLHPATGVVQLSPGHRTAHATVPPGTVRPEHVGQAVPFMFDSPLDLPRDISTTQSSNTLGSMEQPPQPIQPSVSDPDAHTASARLTRSHSRTSFDSLLFYLFSPTPSQEPPPPGTTDWDIQGEFDSCQDLSVHAHDKLPTTDLPSNEEDLLESAEHATQEVVAGVSITSNTYGSGRIPEWWTTPLARSSDAARMKDLCQKGPLYHARPSSTSTARLPTLVHPSPRLLISLLGSIGVIGTAASEEDEATTWNTPFPAALDHMLKIVGGDGKEKFGPDVMSNEARDDWEELKWKADREYDERLHSKYALSLSEQAQEDSADVMEMDSDSDSVIAEPVSEWEELKRVIDRESEPRFMWDTDGTEKHLRGITLESILEYERSVIPASGGDRDKSRIEVLLAEDSPSAVGREKNVADAGIVVTAPIGLGIITRTSSHANLLKYHAGDIVGLRSSLSTASI